MQKFNLIFLQSGKTLISQKQYSDWKEIQDDFQGYIASVGFNSIDEIKEYIQFDYKLTEEKAIKESNKIFKSNTDFVEVEL
ncbi:hypothetical protein [Flammeovirga kamogawensis]|uniref:Phage protein n=1 Tax=Flammeovirga kamogawensis TaxID=373891 RepID=A0ABX8H0A3_9BACT|nr:hypothetical protein [Flammeovirga kamogawensis]QWG09251.1 hypothetical protein KM029_21845 [Flammeovirga kamogawensis]QWG09882.1 hypothetical protein KM029_19570 [Flammeovirga kamogawensis]QWG09893.1 hypothetical protein KM029_19625 [Flammeovirga kamogawensis]QWG09910.1 hypothetical protein KM029_19710 [Flammeovirga kamogawensis]QWG09937.1 hypothetical protein KM029_19845 [Flammeovirga kamogawensis]